MRLRGKKKPSGVPARYARSQPDLPEDMEQPVTPQGTSMDILIDVNEFEQRFFSPNINRLSTPTHNIVGTSDMPALTNLLSLCTTSDAQKTQVSAPRPTLCSVTPPDENMISSAKIRKKPAHGTAIRAKHVTLNRHSSTAHNTVHKNNYGTIVVSQRREYDNGVRSGILQPQTWTANKQNRGQTDFAATINSTHPTVLKNSLTSTEPSGITLHSEHTNAEVSPDNYYETMERIQGSSYVPSSSAGYGSDRSTIPLCLNDKQQREAMLTFSSVTQLNDLKRDIDLKLHERKYLSEREITGNIHRSTHNL